MGQDNSEYAAKYIVELEEVVCNACGSRDHETLAERERFGLPLRTVICKNCGLIFLNPRPTKEMYAAFYESDYRKTVSGSDEGDADQFQREFDFAHKVTLPVVKRLLPQYAPKTIMELGSSYGGILHAFMQNFPGSRGFGVEPLLKIGEYSRQRTGATIHTGFVEDFTPDQKYDLVILSRTLNHTLDPKANLVKVREMLAADGVFALTLLDTISHSIHMPFERATEMTHPYMFTRENIQYLLNLAGLEVIGYQDEYIDARRMTRRDYRKLSFSYMVILSRPAQDALVPQKPDYKDTVARIQANQRAFAEHGAFIESWRKPNLFMRAYRKLLYLMGQW
jgi:hypothetical protein